jgi:hypothetical protein
VDHGGSKECQAHEGSRVCIQKKAGRLLTSNCSKVVEEEWKKDLQQLASDDKQYRLARCCTHCNWESLTDRMTSSRESQRLEARLRMRAITIQLFDHVIRQALSYSIAPFLNSTPVVALLDFDFGGFPLLRPSAFCSGPFLSTLYRRQILSINALAVCNRFQLSIMQPADAQSPPRNNREPSTIIYAAALADS